MGSLGTGFLGDGRCPVLALPVDQVVGQFAGVLVHAFPPHVTVVGQGHVRENHVLVQAGHAVGVGQRVGARGHAEVASLGVDGVQAGIALCILAGLDPGDVVANGGDFPAVERLGRHQHGEVGFAAGAGEGTGHVVLLAFGAGQAQDEHVFGQPPLVSAHSGRDAQCEAFLAQQRIAAVA